MRIHSNKPPVGQAPQCAIQDGRRVSAMDKQEKTVESNKYNRAGNVEISGKSREIANIMAAINRLPDVRDARVQEIQQSIQAGMYSIDPRKIAEKMIGGL